MATGNFLLNWLNNEIKLSRKVANIPRDFSNFYYYGEIFEILGLTINNYQNKLDDQSRKENFEKLLQISKEKLNLPLAPDPSKFNHQEFITNLKNTSFLLKKRSQMPQLSNTYKSQSALQFSSSLSETLGTKDNHLINSLKKAENQRELPPKLIRIEQKLEKFKAEQYKHLLDIQRMKQEEDERYKIEVKELTITDRKKIAQSIDYIKKKAQEQFKNWKKNQTIKNVRLEKQKKVEDFLTEKLQNSFLKAKENDHNDMREGLLYFEANCQKLGIELIHEFSEKPKPEKHKFSALSAMQKIRERKSIADYAKRERDVRKTKILVEQRKFQAESDARKNENDLLFKFNEASKLAFIEGEKNYIKKKSKLFIEEKLFKESELKKNERNKELDKLNAKIRMEETENERIRSENYREKKIEYMELNLEKKIIKREQYTVICNKIMEFVLDLTDICYRKTEGKIDFRIESTYWREAMEIFKDNKPLVEKKKFTIFDENNESPRYKSIEFRTKEDIQKQFDEEMNNYLFCQEYWYPLFHEKKSTEPFSIQNNDYLGHFLYGLIDLLFPPKPVKSPPEFPNYLPLKISIIGKTMSGKKTMADLLKQKYGIELISPEDVIKESLFLTFPPEEIIDPKAKQIAKKKVVEEPKPVPPLLKELAIKAKENEGNEGWSDDLLVLAIVSKILTIFNANKNNEELINELKECKNKAADRLKELQKQQEELEKKQKKTIKQPVKNKKTGATIVQEEQIILTPEEKLQEILNKNQFYYTKGFCLIDFPRTLKQAKLLEEAFSGYVDPDDRKNAEAEIIKKDVLVHPPEPIEKKEEFVPTAFDLIININLSTEECVRRSNNNNFLESILENQKENQENVLSWFSKFGSTQSSLKSIDGIGEKFEVFTRIEDELSSILIEKHKDYDDLLNGNEIKEKAIKNNEEAALSIVDVSKISIQEAEIIWKSWAETQTVYTDETAKTLKKMEEGRKLLINRIKELQKKFLEIIDRPDDKSSILLKFQEIYNKFAEDHNSMLRESITHEELEKHIDNLYENLWDSIERRKNDAINERISILKSGWIENEMEKVYSDFQKLMQNEINKLLETLVIIQNYYGIFQESPILDLFEHLIIDPFGNKEPIFENKLNSENFEKMRLIYEHTLGLIDKSIPHIMKNQKKKSNKNNNQIESNNEEIELIQKECLHVMEIERDSCHEKIRVLMLLAISRLKELRVFAVGLYSKLDDWIINGIKAENQQIYQLISQIRKTVKDQSYSDLKGLDKLSISLKYHPLKYIGLYNYQYPFIEQKLPNRFKINELKLLYEDTKSLCNNFNQLSNNLLLEYLIRRTCLEETQEFFPDCLINKREIISDSLIDKNIHKKTYKSEKKNNKEIIISEKIQPKIDYFNNMIAYFDPENNGFINWKKFICHMALLSSKPAQINDIEELEKNLKEIEKNLKESGENSINDFDFSIFSDVPTWFDESEKEFNNENEICWRREKFIKKIIFEACVEDHKILILDELISIIPQCSSDNNYNNCFEMIFLGEN